MSSTEKKSMFLGQSNEDSDLYKSLILLEGEARDEGDDFDADYFALAAARLCVRGCRSHSQDKWRRRGE